MPPIRNNTKNHSAGIDTPPTIYKNPSSNRVGIFGEIRKCFVCNKKVTRGIRVTWSVSNAERYIVCACSPECEMELDSKDKMGNYYALCRHCYNPAPDTKDNVTCVNCWLKTCGRYEFVTENVNKSHMRQYVGADNAADIPIRSKVL